MTRGEDALMVPTRAVHGLGDVADASKRMARFRHAHSEGVCRPPGSRRTRSYAWSAFGRCSCRCARQRVRCLLTRQRGLGTCLCLGHVLHVQDALSRP